MVGNSHISYTVIFSFNEPHNVITGEFNVIHSLKIIGKSDNMCELTNYTKDTSSLCKNKQRIKIKKIFFSLMLEDCC